MADPYWMVNPTDCINAAIALSENLYITDPEGVLLLEPATYGGNRCVYLTHASTPGVPTALFVCLGLLDAEVIPGSYGVIPGEWDTYLNQSRAPGYYLPNIAVAEYYFANWVESKALVMQNWINGTFEMGPMTTTNYADSAVYCIDLPIYMSAAGSNVTVNNKYWYVVPGDASGYYSHSVQGMTPLMGSRQPGGVSLGGGLDKIVQALQDIAQRTTVFQINNRGAIADLASGDVVAPGGTDVPE